MLLSPHDSPCQLFEPLGADPGVPNGTPKSRHSTSMAVVPLDDPAPGDCITDELCCIVETKPEQQVVAPLPADDLRHTIGKQLCDQRTVVPTSDCVIINSQSDTEDAIVTTKKRSRMADINKTLETLKAVFCGAEPVAVQQSIPTADPPESTNTLFHLRGIPDSSINANSTDSGAVSTSSSTDLAWDAHPVAPPPPLSTLRNPTCGLNSPVSCR